MLVYYSESRPGRHDPLKDALRNGNLTDQSARFVRCRLYVSHEPDRRFVGQYGVSRAPAWIVIHPDGTYHAQMGAASPEEVAAFIGAATPPGTEPARYSYLPTSTVESWYSSIQEAESIARNEKRPLLIVYTRMLSRDWDKLKPFLETLEVRRASSNFVRCHEDIAGPWSETVDSRFGNLRLPALVVQQTGVDAEIIEQPNSARAIVELLRREKSHARQDSASADGAEDAPPAKLTTTVDDTAHGGS